MKWKNFPNWLKGGIIIFPVVIILSLILNLLIQSNPLLWLIIPTIIWEELFENISRGIADCPFLNPLFALVFWFVTGALIGLIIEKIKNKKRK